jgi:Fe-S-cluster containining protein
VEKLYLKSGFNTLDAVTQRDILARCDDVLKVRDDDPCSAAYRNAVCVLNIGGKCALYPYRPMICRLAGIPHFFLRPDGRIVEGDGCTRYRSDVQPVCPGLKIDRTPFYRGMALLEIDVMRKTGKRAVCATIAETMRREDCPPQRC